ncbi:signal peptidase I [Aureivirga sp. CE67]|uniref:signal peptidase I n=1 Tax=Aureivirga sp. CE67 TaxID=1788983 RepID=UPI0018CB60C5|nr:signal peptidase I [Aureivirga sp. CE67]
MSLVQMWFLFMLLVQVVHFLGTWKLYKKAGRKPWEALVPIYNAIVLMKIINRPWWWTFLLFVPVVNLLMFPVIWVETIRSFGKNSTFDTIAVIVTLGLYTYYVNYATDVEYIEDRSLKPGSEVGEWISSILFAIIAATMVHTYFIQPFTIPTSSLEKTLLIGDFLFVSKVHYGARTPMTTVATPMVHDSLPLVKAKSYLTKPELPYFRLPGVEEIERNDIVVFNHPTDTAKTMWGDKSGEFTYKPIDKKTNYVKRCVGLPGDSLSVKDGYVYINGKKNKLPSRAKIQFFYEVELNPNASIPSDILKNVREGRKLSNTKLLLNLPLADAVRLKNNPSVKSIIRQVTPAGQFDKTAFPHSRDYDFNLSNLGPIYIPEEGKTVKLDTKVLPFYREVIELYENNNLTIDGETIYINGQVADSYTFKQNYFWMMGDNRDNSLDSRAWGYVPFDHIVGKPVFIWMSWNSQGQGFDKIRWERMFTTVHGEGKPVSYFYYFLSALLVYIAVRKFQKKRKENK